MKKFNKALIIFIIIFTPLLSQVNKNLIMPDGCTKINVLVEDPRELLTISEVESFVKLKLRRNNIEYFANFSDRKLCSPTLYINLNIADSQGDLYFGNIELSFQRGELNQISTSDYFTDLNFYEYTRLKGRNTIFGATVKTYSTIFIKSPPAKDRVKSILDGLLDRFISEYIDANNL